VLRQIFAEYRTFNPMVVDLHPILNQHLLESDCGLVYRWCMSRTNIDIDEKACAAVMRRYQFSTKREAVNFALQTLATEPFNLDEARKLRGSGWDGDLDEMRTNRST
jgi:Arc/MetJ family transcription regulator